MTSDQIITLITSILPTMILLFGGQVLLNFYALSQKTKEQEIELIRSVREKQYEAVEALYHSFSVLMAVYRKANSPSTDLDDIEQRRKLLEEAIQVESEIDGLILRIGCEFTQQSTAELERLLGHLRQAVQMWRERIQAGERLPFSSSNQEAYVKFKETFAATASFMVSRIQNSLEPPRMRMEEATKLLIRVFSNKYEIEEYIPIVDKY